MFEEALWRMANALPARLLMSYKTGVLPKDPTELTNGQSVPGEVDIAIVKSFNGNEN